MLHNLLKLVTLLDKFVSMKSNPIQSFCILVFTAVAIFSCGDDKSVEKEKPAILLKKDKPKSKSDTTPSAVPIINISDTIEQSNWILCFKDSAINTVRLSKKLGQIYDEKISAAIKKGKLNKTGPSMAWYKSQKAPFFFEAGIPVDKKPTKLPKGAFVKKLGGTRIIVAHYYGPYEETIQAYQILKDWIKENHKKTAGPAYEIYIGNPIDEAGNVVDPYKVQTDIVIPYH